MRQLSGTDVSFLNMETPTVVGHVSSLNIFDPDGVPGGGGYDAMRALLLERLDQLPPYRRRLREVPLGLDLPYWVEDPDFDVDFHVRNLALPPPGDDFQLAEQVARIVSRPLDRSRPLWELYIIEGLDNGYVAHLNKVHHATIDGASGALTMGVLYDEDPDIRPTGEVASWTPERVPTDAEMLQRTALAYFRRPEKVFRLNTRILRQFASSTQNGGMRTLADLAAQPMPGPFGDLLRQRLRSGEDVDQPPALPPTNAPRTPFNHSISPHRRFAFTSLPLAEVKRIKTAAGSTLNDVVMALCSSTLRRYLERQGALPDEPLVAMVPVSIRSGDEDDVYQNRVSGLLCGLATDEKDPVERLLKIRTSMNAAKELRAALPADALQEYSNFAPPALAARAMRMYSRTKIADRMNPPFNLIISNVPGPTKPLYSAGAKLLHFYPVSAVADGQGLNMTVQSYNGNLDFGFISCRELLPDVWDLTFDLHAALEELSDAV
jgi:WS/DGAT/MGAT family acyltransferase